MALWIAIAVLVAAGALLIIAMQPIRVEVEYWREGSDDRLLLLLKGPFGLVFQRTEIPVLDFSFTSAGPAISFVQESQDAIHGGQRKNKTKVLIKEIRKMRKVWRKLRRTIEAYKPAIDYMLDHVFLEALTWETKLGTSDAAVTGVLTGMAWSVKGTVVTALQSRFPVFSEKASIAVSPAYYRSYFSTFFHCIFSIRLVHVINVQFKLLEYKLRQRKR